MEKELDCSVCFIKVCNECSIYTNQCRLLIVLKIHIFIFVMFFLSHLVSLGKEFNFQLFLCFNQM